jgi:hypothetical protein
LRYGCNFLGVESASSTDQALLAHSRQLVSHCFSISTLKAYPGLTRIDARHIRTQGYDLDPIKVFVRGIIADDNRRSPPSDLSAN